MTRPGQGGNFASGRLSTCSGSSAPRPRVDNPEALLRLKPRPGFTRASASDVAPAAPVGTENRVQWMINAIQPRIQAWVEEFLGTELPQVPHVCLDRTVPALVDAHVRSAIPPLLDERLLVLVQREVATALATVDEESPSGTALEGAISSTVANRLATTFPADAGVDARAQRDSTALEFTKTQAEPIRAAPGISTMAPHPEGKSIYLPPFYGATGGPTDNGPPVLADTAGPAGEKTAWGASRQKSDSRIGRAEEAHPALKDTPRRVQKTPLRQKTQDVATERRTPWAIPR